LAPSRTSEVSGTHPDHLLAGEPNNYFSTNQQCAAAVTVWVYKYSYFAGTTLSATAVNSNYVVLNDGSDLIGWADEECTKEYAYICELTGRSSCCCQPMIGAARNGARCNNGLAGPAPALLSPASFVAASLLAVSCAWTAPPPSAG
jgi:hypothetical protein